MSVVTVRRTRLAPASRRILRSTFTRRTCADLVYVIAGLPLAVVGFAANLGTLWFPMIQVSAPAMGKLGDANRFLAFRLAGERVPAPPPLRAGGHIHLRTPAPARVSALVAAHGGRVRELKDEGRHGSQLKIGGLPAARLAGLAAVENIAVSGIHTHPAAWLRRAVCGDDEQAGGVQDAGGSYEDAGHHSQGFVTQDLTHTRRARVLPA